MLKQELFKQETIKELLLKEKELLVKELKEKTRIIEESTQAIQERYAIEMEALGMGEPTCLESSRCNSRGSSTLPASALGL